MRNSARPRYQARTIKPAERADILVLVCVTIAAESGSVLHFLRYPSPEQNAKLARALIKVLDENFDAPQLLIMKALDADTKEITAMAIWQLNGYGNKKLGIPSEEENFGATFNQPEGKPGLRVGPGDVMLAAGLLLPSDTHIRAEQEQASALWQYIEAKFSIFFNTWTAPTKHIYLTYLMTDPRFQRRGIGRLMLEWGHKRANQDGVPMFLIVAPFGVEGLGEVC
jgi:ribosomal protein S18 acetylase RimI-like enzyme